MQLFGIIVQCKRSSSDDFQHFSKIGQQQMYYKSRAEITNCTELFIHIFTFHPGSQAKHIYLYVYIEMRLIILRRSYFGLYPICVQFRFCEAGQKSAFLFSFFDSSLCAILTSMKRISKKRNSVLVVSFPRNLVGLQFDTSCPQCPLKILLQFFPLSS